MKIDFRMWRKAVTVMPRVANEEWRCLGFISWWLMSTRFAAIVMTVTSVLITGILSHRVTNIDVLVWVALMVSLVFAHATNNLVNALLDSRAGVDHDNCYRGQYGPQPQERGFKTMPGQLIYAAVNGAVALVLGVLADTPIHRIFLS